MPAFFARYARKIRGRAPGPTRGPCSLLFALAGRRPPRKNSGGPRPPGPPWLAGARGPARAARWSSGPTRAAAAPDRRGLRLASLAPLAQSLGRGSAGRRPATAVAAGLGRPPRAPAPRSLNVLLGGGRAPQFGGRGRRFRVRSLRSRWRPPSPDRRPPRPTACGVRSPRASCGWLARCARGQPPAALAGGRRSAAARGPPAPCLAPVAFGPALPPLLCRVMRLACFAASRPPRRRQPLAALAVKTAAAAGRRSCGSASSGRRRLSVAPACGPWPIGGRLRALLHLGEAERGGRAGAIQKDTH